MVSKHADLDGPVHYLDFGGSGPALVCAHGLSGSALNWMAVGPALAERHRVLALDLRGFGRTPLGPGTRLGDNRHLLDRFLRDVVRGLALSLWAFFASLLPPLLGEASLGWSGRRMGAERVVRGVLEACCVDAGRVREDIVQALVEQEIERFASPRSFRALAQASRSLLWALGRRGLMGTYGRLAAPTLLVHGEADRIVPVAFSLAIARRFGWPVEVLPDTGHVPTMEVPADFLRVTLGWLESHEPAAA